MSGQSSISSELEDYVVIQTVLGATALILFEVLLHYFGDGLWFWVSAMLVGTIAGKYERAEYRKVEAEIRSSTLAYRRFSFRTHTRAMLLGSAAQGALGFWLGGPLIWALTLIYLVGCVLFLLREGQEVRYLEEREKAEPVLAPKP